jgi:hypothetical protein
MKSSDKQPSMKTQITNLIHLTQSAVMLAAFMMTCDSIRAGKPPGGGGSAPAGTIYFSSPTYQGDGLTYSMKADGTQKTPLGISVPNSNASPSRLTHGGKRWFLQKLPVPGQDIHGNERWENFVVREDGAVAVQLTDDPAMHISLDWTPAESATEAVVSGLGRRWNADGTPDVASMGVYVATLHFDADGTAVGLDAPPGFLLSVGVVDPDGTGWLWWDSYSGYSFSPDMTRLVIDHYASGTGLRIIDVATGAETPLVSGNVRMPAWSPDGARIAFVVPPTGTPAKIDAISPNGTGRATIFKARWANEYVYSPTWSPDSVHVAFRYNNGYPFEHEVYRAPAGGGKAVNLTADFEPRALLLGWQ